jgi:protoheme IX farnesyltransferase
MTIPLPPVGSMSASSATKADDSGVIAAIETKSLGLDSSYLSHPNDYFLLLKPRVMSLVVFTAATGFFMAPQAGTGLHPFLAIIAILCIAIGAGAAGALNMALEAKTDALMRRTRARPVAAGRISVESAMGFGIIMAMFSVALMALAVNLLAAFWLGFTILYYVLFYTLLLKRRTAQNIVIGGAAGALPPVIGWAAASGSLTLEAWLLFLIIFLWTPPHSWALALCANEDYRRAGIPMMPVKAGAKSTRIQIFLYSLAFVPVACLPAFVGMGGLGYGTVSVLGGLVFLYMAILVLRSKAGETPQEREDGSLYNVQTENLPARNLFAYSILYLTLLFMVLLLEAIFLKGSL